MKLTEEHHDRQAVDVEAWARTNRMLVEYLIFAGRTVPFGKVIISFHEGSIISYEIHRYERRQSLDEQVRKADTVR